MTKHPGQVKINTLATMLNANDFPTSLPAFCAAQAQAFGDAIAIDYFQDGVQLSYRALHQRSNRIAANFLKRGFRKGAHIAVMLPNGPASVLIWFAIMKIGAVIVPVNTAYRGKELDYILNQSDAQALILETPFLDAFGMMEDCPELLKNPILIEGSDLGKLEGGDPLSEFDPGYPVGANDLANLQYTSGTTGVPKGCMLTQDYWIVLSHSIAQIHCAAPSPKVNASSPRAVLAVMQASRFECLSFDPFSLFQNGFVASEEDDRWRDVVQALVRAMVVVVVDEASIWASRSPGRK